ncbi:hypothetical protein BE21_02475 [Sorangium cellulosum]|uniref:Uncharacterized protein n=1 Tax=Sorangium cellulosum TaxID=56 RepID=A0A150TRU2_SORCE|nr:hypothetical protein BE21_02475 [Sorangium cellulosum]
MLRTDAQTVLNNAIFRLYAAADEAAVDLARELDVLACDESGQYAIQGTTILDVRERAALLATALRTVSSASLQWAVHFHVGAGIPWTPGCVDGVQTACWEARVTIMAIVRALRCQTADTTRRAAVLGGAMVRLVWQVRDIRGSLERALSELVRERDRAERGRDAARYLACHR